MSAAQPTQVTGVNVTNVPKQKRGRPRGSKNVKKEGPSRPPKEKSTAIPSKREVNRVRKDIREDYALHRTTNDIIEQYVKRGLDYENAESLFNDLINDPDRFRDTLDKNIEEYKQEQALYGYLSKIPKDEIYEFTPEDYGEPRKFNIGCDYKGYKSVKEETKENLYIPSSDYCYIKCINKYFELTKSSKRVPTRGLHPYASKKMTLTNHLKKHLGDDCFEKFKLPDFVKMRFNPTTNKLEMKLLSNDARNNPDYSIALLHLGNNDYHAILLYKSQLSLYTIDDIKLKFVMERKLNVDFTANKQDRYRTPARFVISYDIETYSELRFDKKGKEYKELLPVALGWVLIDLESEKTVSPYFECIIQTREDNLFNMFLKQLTDYLITTDHYKEFLQNYTEMLQEKDQEKKQKLSLKLASCFYKIQIFAHNGSRFDNIYAKKQTLYEFTKIIPKAVQVKKLELKNSEDRIIYIFKDTLPFTQSSLKQSCKTFKTDVKKQKFDIVDKSFEWYKDNEESTDPISNWREYLKYDVMSLASLIIKVEKLFRHTFSTSITNFTGLPGAAYYLMNTYCMGMRYLKVPKDPSCVSFINACTYGGRVLCWKRHYKLEEGFDKYNHKRKGLVSIDMNSLYPSVMAHMGFPIGEPIQFKKDELKDFNKKVHYIVNVKFRVPNIRYAYHPYKTSDGMLIYPSNGEYEGVYCDVDLREMMKDGYEILEVKDGWYWPRSKRIFTNLMEDIYKRRSYFKSIKPFLKDENGNDLLDENGEKVKNPDYAMQPAEQICKTMMNSMAGKFRETIKTSTVFIKDLCDIPVTNSLGLTQVENLPNGQKEVTYKLTHDAVFKPSYIFSYIVAYARGLVNEIIRSVGPENIYYSDTDSLYLPAEVLEQAGLKFSSDLCGFKNDYKDSEGNDKHVIEAMFLDMKRYYVILKNEKDESLSVKAGFNGLSFNNAKFSTNFYAYAEKYKNYKKIPIDDKIEIDRKIFRSIYEAYKNKSDEKEKLKIAFLNFVKTKTGVRTCIKDMIFQVDPDKRGVWDENDEFYSLGFDKKLPEYIIEKRNEVGSLQIKGMCCELISYTKHTQFYEGEEKKKKDSNSNGLADGFTDALKTAGLAADYEENKDKIQMELMKPAINCSRPLMYKTSDIKNFKNISETSAITFKKFGPDNEAGYLNFFLYVKNGREEVVYRERTTTPTFNKDGDHVGFKSDYDYYTINCFGNLYKFVPDQEDIDEDNKRKEELSKIITDIYTHKDPIKEKKEEQKAFTKYMTGLIALRDTEENVKKYGRNYITEKQLEDIIRYVMEGLHKCDNKENYKIEKRIKREKRKEEIESIKYRLEKCKTAETTKISKMNNEEFKEYMDEPIQYNGRINSFNEPDWITAFN